jgi:signal transduction histidine kinase
MNSIYFKNFMATAAMVIVSFFILGSAFVFLGRSFIVTEKRDNISENASEVVRAATAFSQDGDLQGWDLRMSISAIARSTGNHIFICDADGLVVTCSDMEVVCPHIGKQLGSAVMTALRQYGGLDQLTDLDGFYAGTYYVVAMPIPDLETGEAAGYAFVSSDSTTMVSAWNAFMNLFLIVAIAVMIVALCLSYVTSKRAAKPINEMAAAARRFAHGEYDVRVEDDGREDEIGALTQSFNAMAESIEKSEELRREFIANVSHELKTPMTTIAGFADGILDGTIPKENQDKYLATISAETKRLSRLVRRMLELSRIQSGASEELRRHDFDAAEMLRRTLLNFEDKITAKGLSVDAQLPEEPMRVLGDEDAITQVVYNLLDNAIKFSEPASELGLSLWKQGLHAYVSVRNHGDTIPAEELPLVFDRFHKTDRSRSRDRDGVGLGLYIVKAILNQHEEDISVTSRDGVTEFVFTLSLKPDTSRPSAQKPLEDKGA